MPKQPPPQQSEAEQCTGKVKHASKTAAHAQGMSMYQRKGRKNYCIYQCPWCGFFHVAHGKTMK